jgi:acetyltransferase-like isoleucine patch superfamily enzyme
MMRPMRVPRNWRKVPWYLRYDLGMRMMTKARVTLIRATHLHARVEFHSPGRIGPGFQLEIPDAGTFIVGPGVDFRRGFVCEIAGNGRVVIGERTTFTSHCMIQCSTSIEIGRRCSIGQSTLIFDGTHRYLDSDKHWLDQGYDFRPVRIGDGVGISDKCTVNADIGERAMIGSHSVVNRPIPPYCVAAGVPARVIRKFGPSGEDPAASTLAVADDGEAR